MNSAERTIEVIVAAAMGDDNLRTRLSFMSLPFELRDRVYTFAAISCSDIGPLKPRSTLEASPKFACPLDATTTMIHAHTLHNLMLVNRDIHAEARSVLYRYTAIRLSLGHALVRQALDNRHYGKPKEAMMLAELRECRLLILAKDLKLDDRWYEHPVGDMPKLLDWWNSGRSSRVPSAQLHIQLLDYIQGPKLNTMANSIIKWLATHIPDNDYLKRSLRFMLRDIDRTLEADLRLCSISIAPGRAFDVDRRRQQVTQVRSLCRKYPGLVISNIDWAIMEEKPIDHKGLEIVRTRQYIPRVGPRVLAARSSQAG